MELYLLRHGSAVDIGEWGVRTDGERMLTRKGRECTEEVLRALREVCRPQGIWTSPLVRACETAEIAREVLAAEVPVKRLEFLLPGGNTVGLLQWLSSRKEDSLMLVGHMPDLAILAGSLTSGVESGGIAFKKSGVCCIVFEERIGKGKGQLGWLVTPSLLRLLSIDCGK